MKTNCYTVSHFLALTLTGWICFISRGAEMVCSFAFVAVNKSPRSCSSCSRLHAASQLEQLASMTTLSIDSGDLKVIEEYASTGLITDATTNPLFVSQVGLNSGDPFYASLVNDAVNFAVQTSQDQQGSTAILTEADMVALAIDKLSVNLGAAISSIVKGFISTEVDTRLSFDTQASVERERPIIQLYQQMGVHKSRVLVKLAATWEGICAAEVLEAQGIQCNLTLVFSFIQAVACAQKRAHLISPFPGRILDWHHKSKSPVRTSVATPEEDEGVLACKKMYNYFKCHGHDTICMPASWRPSRGAGFELDEIRALAGTDRMTIPATLLQKLAECNDPLPRVLNTDDAKKTLEPLVGGGNISEKEFRYLFNMDGCGTDKMAEGIRAFISETEKLEIVIAEKVRAVAQKAKQPC